MRLIFAALALMSSVAVAAPPCAVSGLPFKPETRGSYHTTRGKLIDAGFMPVPQTLPASFTPADQYRALGYIEVRDVGNHVTLYGWKSPNGKTFTLYQNHLGKIGVDQCGLADSPTA